MTPAVGTGAANAAKVTPIRHETPSGVRYQFLCLNGHKHETRQECWHCSNKS